MLRRILVLIGLIVGIVGAVVFTATSVLVWSAKAEADRQVQELSAWANEAGAAAEHAVTFVQGVLHQADQDLHTAREEMARQPAQPVNPFVRLTARQATQQLAGSVDRVHGAVVTATDAVVVAKAALKVVGNSTELEQLLGVDTQQVDATREALMQASDELRRARSVLGITIGDGSDGLSADQLNAVDRALAQAHSFTDAMARVVATTRQQVADTQRQVELWSRRLAVGITLACAWAALGQVFLARYCWRSLWGQPA
jgi:hypothetical protein